MRRDPMLTPADQPDLTRSVPVVTPRIAAVGLFGQADA
jgi:hypothetical protein